MGRELGRISGSLLSADLLRDGVDLAFETDLLYLKVSPAVSRNPLEDGDGNPQPGSSAIGINSDSPSKLLFVNNTINTTNLIVDTQFSSPKFIVANDTIQTITGAIYISPDQTLNPTINALALSTANLKFDNNALTSTNSINFTPTGTGVSNIRNDVFITGGLHATGSIRWDGGTLTLGSSSDDNVSFAADVNSNIIPNNPGGVEMYELGSLDQQWGTLYSQTITASSMDSGQSNISTLVAGNISLTSNIITNVVAGQPIQISPNGAGVAMFNNNNYIYQNEIVNRTDSALTMIATGPGYYKFTGTNGLVIPTGPTVGPEGAELGMIRFNTDLGYVRVFNGTEWISAIGSSASLSIEDTTDVMDVWTLILG